MGDTFTGPGQPGHSAAAGLGGGILASVVAFTPSFAFVLLGAQYFGRLRGNGRARAFLDAAGPAAIGAILGSAITLAQALTHPRQYLVLAGALVLLLPCAAAWCLRCSPPQPSG